MLGSIILFAKNAASIVLLFAAVSVGSALVYFVALAYLIVIAITSVAILIKYLAQNYIFPSIKTAISVIITHPLTVLAIMITIVSLTFVLDKDFRSFILNLNYPLILTISSVIVAALNALILGTVVTNLLMVLACLTVVTGLYKIIPRLLDKKLNQLIKAKVVTRFQSLYMSSETLAYAKKPHTLDYLVERKCSLVELENIISLIGNDLEKTSHQSYYQKYDAHYSKSRRDKTNESTILESLLAKPHIQAMIHKNRLTFTEIIAFWPLTFLDNKRLADLYQSGEISLEECHNISQSSSYMTNIQLDIFSNGLNGESINNVKSLTNNMAEVLALPHVQALYHSKQLSLSMLSSFNSSTLNIFKIEKWMQSLCPKNLPQLSQKQKDIIVYNGSYELLSAIQNNPKDIMNLDEITLQRVLNILSLSLSDLTDQQYAYNLSIYQWNVLWEYRRQLVRNHKIEKGNLLSVEHWPLYLNNLTRTNCETLLRHGVKQLINERLLTFDQAIRSSREELDTILANGQIARMIIMPEDQRRRINLAQFQDGFFAHPVHAHSETTHRASVHKTASESALRLLNRYPNIYVNKNINELRGEINKTGHQHKTVAQRAIMQLSHPLSHHVDAISDISNKHLLALVYEAISDSTVCTAEFSDALNAFINGLYDIQRGKNSDNRHEVDDGEYDKPICPPGTFNKLIEVLCGVHPDAHQEYITLELASNKLPIIVNEEVFTYLAQQKSQRSTMEWQCLYNNISTHGVDIIYHKIRHAVKQRVCDEYMILFTNKPFELDNFIDQGRYANINTALQRLIQETGASTAPSPRV